MTTYDGWRGMVREILILLAMLAGLFVLWAYDEPIAKHDTKDAVLACMVAAAIYAAWAAHTALGKAKDNANAIENIWHRLNRLSGDE